MKLTINGYDVEIKAKYSGATKFNKIHTMDFLNLIASWASHSADQMQAEGWDMIAKDNREAFNTIYDELAKRGLYDNIH